MADVMDVVYSHVVHFLTSDYPFASELQGFWMAFGGHLMVRNGPNRDGTMNWFHAFTLGLVTSHGGGAFTPLWMGRPSALLSNDVGVAVNILSYLIVNWLPFGIGCKLGNTFIVSLCTTVWSTGFKINGLVGFTAGGFAAFKDHPSSYYPIPIFGPIIWAALLANMSSFFAKGFHGHLKDGMPWGFQNEGPIGVALRAAIRSISPKHIQMGLDDRTFCFAMIGIFMHSVNLMQRPDVLGPSYSPFVMLQKGVQQLLVLVTVKRHRNVHEPAVEMKTMTKSTNNSSSKIVGTIMSAESFQDEPITTNGTKKKRRPRNKKKTN